MTITDRFRRHFAVGSTGLQLQTSNINASAAVAEFSLDVFWQPQNSLVWKLYTVFDLLLTRAFCFQPCGLNLIVMLRINHSRESCDSSFFALLFSL